VRNETSPPPVQDTADFFDRRYAEGEEVLAEKKLFALDLLRQLRPSPAEDGRPVRVLDLGCGTGRITQFLVEAGYDVTGADISTTAIARLKERGIDGFVHDVKDPLPCEDHAFDVVWASDLLELVPDIFLFVHEVHRVLLHGGLFVFTSVNMGWWYYRLGNLAGRSASDLMPPSHCRFWTRHAVKRFLDGDLFRIRFLGGVAPIPWFGGIRRLRMHSLNLVARDLVGACERI